MDDTTQSRTSDAAASAATRKRRSSILKSQRPPRTPFCELEFNVSTPADSSKSRRVSFSRRTGVAEFATNEATTTWKNFYEEHNKSLESSGNDSEMNHGKQPIAHLGKRIFDQQFEEVEAFEFMGTLNPGINISTSINNINFAQLECTETRLTAPRSNFELSALTDAQSRLFGDNLAISGTAEFSGRIDANFSAIQQIGGKDDLDEIQADLQRQSNIVCQGPFTEQNLSEYIEVDLNMTHVAIPNDQSDMSITDTIHSPKVDVEVSKSCSIDKKINISDKDWVADKENIVLNPYVTPRESINFAVTELPDEVLVFDGKRLIVETEKPKKENSRQSVISKPITDRAPQRKTIVLNCNDDLPNFLEDAQVSNNHSYFVGTSESCILEDKPAHHRIDETQNKYKTIIFGDDLDDISMTQAVPNVLSDIEKQRTTLYDDTVGNISITQALPSKIISKEKRNTILFENDKADISITQALPTNVIIPNENNEKSRTMVFDNEACNISMTEVIPTNIKDENTAQRRRIVEDVTANVSVSQIIPNIKLESKESRRTVTDKTGNISATHSVTSSDWKENVSVPERRATVVFENDIGNISVTQALPSNIILPQNLNSTAYRNNDDISMTQAVSGNILLGNNIEPHRRRTVVYEDDTGNLSITQAVAKNQVIQGVSHLTHITEMSNIEAVGPSKSSSVSHSSSEDISNTQALNINQVQMQEKPQVPEEIIENKRRTIIFQNDAADISITESISIKQVIECINLQDQKNIKEPTENKRQTILFQNDAADVSITQAVPVGQVIDSISAQGQQNIRNTKVNSEAVCKEILIQKIKTVVSENDDADIHLARAALLNRDIDIRTEYKLKQAINKNSTELQLSISKNQDIDIAQKENDNIKMSNVLPSAEPTNTRKTIVFENDNADISMTQAVPMNKVIDAIQKEKQNIKVFNTSLHEELNNKRRTVVFENDDADISMTQAVSMNKVIDTIHKEKHSFEKQNVFHNINEITNKQKTAFENDDADISMTHVVVNQVIDNTQKENNCVDAEVVLHKEELIAKKSTVVSQEYNEADITMTEAISTIQVIDITQKENQNFITGVASQGSKNRITIMENDYVDTFTIQAADLNPLLYIKKDELKHNYSQKRTEVVNNEIVCCNSTKYNKTPRIVYDDDEGDISMTRAVSSSIILPDGQEKKRTIVVESVESLLDNKDIFMEIDKLTNPIDINKSSDDVSEEDYDIPMSNICVTEIDEMRAIPYIGNDNNIVKATFENFSCDINYISHKENDEKQFAILSKPIPAGLLAIQQKIIDKTLCKEIKHDSMLPDTVSDVLVYQSLTTNTKNLTVSTDKGDSQITIEEEDKNIIEEKKDSSQSLKRCSEVKIPEQEQLKSEPEDGDLVAETISKHSCVKAVDSKPNNSILNDLLDMSQSSFEGTEDKELMTKISSDHDIPTNEEVNEAVAKTSMNTMFYITKDSDDERPTENRQIQGQSPLSIEYKDEDDPAIVRDIQQKLSILKNVIREDDVPCFIPSQSNKLDEDSASKVSLDMSRRKSSKSFRMANDTNELLEMLSDFTDKRLSRNVPLEELNENDDMPESRLSLESKVDLKPEPTRFNRTLKRQSIVLSREDLMNNLSMASAALQKSRPDFDESDSIDEVKETPNISKEHKKSVRLSTDVVKTLQFDDDSISEKNELIQMPLKKTAFGEISYMKETKAKVIPGFLTNVSDGIKELMDDLVKPVTDVQPFSTNIPETVISPKRPSMCSTQIQANLLTSSQIDLNTDLYSTTNSVCDMNKLSSVDIITDAVNRSMSRALNSPVKTISVYSESTKSSVVDVTTDRTGDTIKDTVQPKSVSNARPLGSILVFDQHNPLNNILLMPTPSDAIDIHKYEPLKLEEEPEPQPSHNDEVLKQEEKTTSQYRVELAASETKQNIIDKIDTQSVTSNTSKHMSIDQCTEPRSHRCKDMEINTVIAMKGNEQLLEASSSLTLVDDELFRNTDYSRNTSLRDSANSPVKVIYKIDKPPIEKIDSDLTSTDEVERPSKPKKRVYSPTRRKKHKNCTLSSLDVTPKPVAKIQKRSLSPDNMKLDNLPVKRYTSPEPGPNAPPSRQKSPRRTRSKKPGTTFTIQQLTTMVHVEPAGQEDSQVHEKTDSSTTEPRTTIDSHDVLGIVISSEIMSSFASSNNLRDEKSLVRSSLSGNPSKLEWLPTSASLLVDSVHSEEDLVGIIDSMPFMGSHDCQWECATGPVWTFLLLHSRLRLTIRFAGPPRLRPDTPVLNVELETPPQDKKNPIAYLCVIFAAELMRYQMSRGCCAASHVGKLMRRLAGAARLAGQWARAMHDARARLAYSLSHDGWLALKVANTSYRTVWEVTMQLELVVEDARASPWPRACGVRVTRALAAGPVPPDVSRVIATPHDWGHAPRTIWKVFRYLKNKKKDFDEIAQL